MFNIGCGLLVGARQVLVYLSEVVALLLAVIRSWCVRQKLKSAQLARRAPVVAIDFHKTCLAPLRHHWDCKESLFDP